MQKQNKLLKRIKRMGQEKDIEYTYFTSNLGIFNMIFENNEKKRNLKELLIDKIKEDNACDYFTSKL